MMMIEGINELKGFILKKPICFKGNIIVMTGKNGGGKTRFLESLKTINSKTIYNGMTLTTEEIFLLEHGALTPSFNFSYDDSDHVAKVKHAVDYFKKNKEIFVEKYDLAKDSNHHQMGMARRGFNPITYSQMHKLCGVISQRLNKPVSEITGDDIRINYEDVIETPFSPRNFSLMCNSYRRRIYENEFNFWRATSLGKNVSYIPLDKIASILGPKPWELMNSVVQDLFDGKFKFNNPDESSEIFDYNATLVESQSFRPVSTEDLSSGEKTLLWLALVLLNTQYESKSVKTAPKLLLMDEPDAFLHPKMVCKFYSVLQSFTNAFGGAVIITTHSPTTVALSPEKEICIVSDSNIELADKSHAISELLDGVNQLSIDPENKRYVFVESFYDANIYDRLYKFLQRNKDLSTGVLLNFVPSGEKLPADRIKDTIRSHFGASDEKIAQVISSLNGVGSCNHVKAAVESFQNSNSNFVRGVIDWDETNKPHKGIAVFAENYAYTIENLAYDPISILLMLHTDFSEIYTMESICGSKSISWQEWLNDPILLQVSLDWFIEKIIGRSSYKDAKLEYTSGLQLFTDRQYLLMRGELEKTLLKVYPKLKSYIKNGPDKDLKYSIVIKGMLSLSAGKLISVEFLKLFITLQENH
jgi:energy-coupling factor transporter ATP-binding protein EcfA2